MKRTLVILGIALLCATAVRADNDRDDDNDMDDVAEAKAIAQLASGANATQVANLITSANQFDNDNDNDDDIFDDDWQAIAALAASGKLSGVVGNTTGAALSFLNDTMPSNARAQALYTNVTNAIQQAAKGMGQNIKVTVSDDLDDLLDNSILTTILGFEEVSQGIQLLLSSGAITDSKLNATITKELGFVRQQLGGLVAAAGPLLNNTRKLTGAFSTDVANLNKTVAALLANTSSPQDLQRAAVGLISAGMRDFRNASVAILRDCDSLQTLIGLYATGKTNSSIVQELINVGVGTSSLQSTLQGVFKGLNSTLTAQSTSSSVPADCITTGDMLDDLDVPPTDPRFTAWYQKCSQYMTQWAMKDAADWDDDWARNSNRLQSLLANPSSTNGALNCDLPDWDDDWDNDKWDD